MHEISLTEHKVSKLHMIVISTNPDSLVLFFPIVYDLEREYSLYCSVITRFMVSSVGMYVFHI